MSYPDTLTPDFSARDMLPATDPLISHRWSPRAFVKTAISDSDVATLFDAARWAPSCFNEQPWRFYVSRDETFDDFLKLLNESNQQWAKNASLIGFVVARKTFSQNDSPNPYARFDSGAAWFALTMQARRMGLYTHGMGGLDHEAAAQYLKLDASQYEVVCGFALGVATGPETLAENFAVREMPSPRKPLSEVLFR